MYRAKAVFPAIKKMKYGRLPDFDANGELVEIADDPTRPDEGNTAFARYMDDAILHLFDGREHPLLHGQENLAGVLVLEAAPPHRLSCRAGREDVLHLFARHVLKIFGGKLFLVQ